MTQRILALCAGFLVAAAIGGWGHEHRTPGTGQPQAALAVRALTAGEPDAARLVPADFPAVMGYRPALVRTAGAPAPTRADGGCSSPFGGTPYRFGPDCRQHDLGYDLLRYADAKGQPLGPWARRAVDDRFAAQTLARCDGGGCRATAGLYAGMVRFNSWRQGWAAPAVEAPVRLAGPVAGGLGVALGLGLLPGPRPRHRPLLTGRPA